MKETGVARLPLWVDDFLIACMKSGEPIEATGARVKLWCIAFSEAPAGTLPDDDEQLARWVGVSAKQWASIKPWLAKSWGKTNEGRYLIRRVAEEAERVLAIQRANRASANARWNSRGAMRPQYDSGCERNANAYANAMPPPAPSPAPSPAPAPKEPKRRPSDACAERSASAPRPAPPDTPDDPAEVEGFPCAGPVATWALRRSLADEFRRGYPALDVLAEATRARVWLVANPGRRKTARGMPRFLAAWMAREQDTARASPQPRTPPPMSAGAHTLNAAREAMRRKGLLDEPERNQGPLRTDLDAGLEVPADAT